MLSRSVRHQMLAAHDPALPFRKIAPLLSAADITFVNLESPFSDRGPYYDGGLIFHAPPDAIAGLQLAGVTIASTANNHSRDCGPHGVEFTVSWLRSHGIAALGSSESEPITHEGVVLVKHGVRFGFLGYTFDQQNGNWRDLDPRIAMTDLTVLCRDVTAMRKRADVIIVSMHNGIEYMPKPTRGANRLRARGHRCGRDSRHRPPPACHSTGRKVPERANLLFAREFCVRSIPARSYATRRNCRNFVPG